MGQGSRDIISGGVLLILSITLIMLIPGQSKTFEGDTLAPMSMPLAIAAIIAALSAALVILGFRQRRRDNANATAEPFSPKGSVVYLGATIVVMIGYVAIISWVGFIAATAVALLALSLLFGNRNRWQILTMIIIAPPVIFLFFRYTMLVLLPQGTLFN